LELPSGSLEIPKVKIFATLGVATLFWESVGMKLTLPKWGFGNPLGLPKLQSSFAKVKTPHIGAFLISLESCQNLDVENGYLQHKLWQKKKAENQIGNLTFDH
jgi:hypothetical protein